MNDDCYLTPYHPFGCLHRPGRATGLIELGSVIIRPSKSVSRVPSHSSLALTSKIRWFGNSYCPDSSAVGIRASRTASGRRFWWRSRMKHLRPHAIICGNEFVCDQTEHAAGTTRQCTDSVRVMRWRDTLTARWSSARNPPRVRGWNILQPFPNGTESDAELQVDRDRKHAAAVADWKRRQHCGHRGVGVRLLGRWAR